MKFITCILATSILFLVVRPAIDTLLLQTNNEQSCCSSQCTPISINNDSQDQNKDSDCEGSPCNPFQICSSCVLVCLTIPIDYLPKSHLFSKKGFSYQSAFISQFASDFWQPPKIA